MRRDFLQLGGIVGADHDIGPGTGEHLGSERPERAGSAGDDRRLAADVEQGERILQEVLFGHDGHFGGVDTATSMVTTSLP